jgi:plasmid stabilization system protein ParE
VKRFKVQLSDSAIRDINESLDFYRSRSEYAELRWRNALTDQIESPTKLPERCPKLYEDLEYRKAMIYSHLIIFSILESEPVVRIHRVYHSARQPNLPEELLGNSHSE